MCTWFHYILRCRDETYIFIDSIYSYAFLEIACTLNVSVLEAYKVKMLDVTENRIWYIRARGWDSKRLRVRVL